MSDKKKPEEKSDVKPEAKTELPDTKHHYPDPVGSLTNPKPGKEAAKQGPTSENDALGATAQS